MGEDLLWFILSTSSMRESDSPLDELSRRKYVQAIVAATVAGAAGCTGDGSNTIDTTEPSGNGGNGGTENGGTENGGTENGGTATPSGQQPVEETFTVAVQNLIEKANMSRWQTGSRSAGINWMTELIAPKTPSLKKAFSGHTYDSGYAENVDKISIPVMTKDVEIEPPYDIYETFDERLTYWDEETHLDANVRELTEYVDYGYNQRIFNPSESFKGQAVDQFRYHRWYAKGERVRDEPLNPNEPAYKEAENPQNELAMKYGQAAPNTCPVHPEFTRPYAERFMDAASKDEVKNIRENLLSDRISIERFADNGWGSGVYRLESSDDVLNTETILHLRSDHPNNHVSIPELRIKFSTGSRIKVMRARGILDISPGLLGETGTITRSTVPDYIQDLSRWLEPFGDKIIFNFHNKHLNRLWFRRALAAAINWRQVGANGWGVERSKPTQYDVGLATTVAKKVFPSDFLNNTYKYPIEDDTELAAKWMRKAGYEKQGNSWVGPDGDSPDLSLLFNTSILDYIGGSQTIMANLEKFGIGVSLDGNAWSSYSSALKPSDYNYDMAMIWAGSANVLNAYWTNGHWFNSPLLSGDPDDEPYYRVHVDDKVDGLGRPIQVPLPTEVGNITAPNTVGKKPENLENAEQINIAKVIRRMREPGLSEKEIRDIAQIPARYYNYYLPSFFFHQYYLGAFGNVRDFNFPPEDHKSWKFAKGASTPAYTTMSGLSQVKYDTDYPEP